MKKKIVWLVLPQVFLFSFSPGGLCFSMDDSESPPNRCEGAEGKLSICWDWDVKLDGILAAANRAVVGHFIGAEPSRGK